RRLAHERRLAYRQIRILHFHPEGAVCADVQLHLYPRKAPERVDWTCRTSWPREYGIGLCVVLGPASCGFCHSNGGPIEPLSSVPQGASFKDRISRSG